jgi:general secretion pathway protein K
MMPILFVFAQPSTMRPLNNQRGMALLLVLAITALLAALLSQLSFSTLVDLRLTETYRDSTRAHYLAKGGIQVGRMVLADDKNNYDGNDEMWAQGVVNYPVGGGEVSITITPLDGRININNLFSTSGNIDAVIKDRCLRLFDVLEIDQASAHVDTLIDWLDDDDDPQPAGAESNYYALQTPVTYCKNGPLDTLDELELVAGFTADEVKKLRPHISLYGNKKIHLNSATAEVLYALAEEMDMPTAETIIAQRKNSPYKTLDEMKLLPNMDSFYWAINSHLQVEANYYRIDTDARVGDGRCRTSAVVKKENNTLLYFQLL